MKKTALIIGSIEIILGLLSSLLANLVNETLPKLAQMCFMFNSGGFSPNDYNINMKGANTITFLLCALGVARKKLVQGNERMEIHTILSAFYVQPTYDLK